MFGNQFNIGPIEGVSESGPRVMIAYVYHIIGEVRHLATKCGWCGDTSLDVPDEKLKTNCPACDNRPSAFGVERDHELAVIDRIRPLITIDQGESKVIYYAKPFAHGWTETWKNSEGQEMTVEAYNLYKEAHSLAT